MYEVLVTKDSSVSTTGDTLKLGSMIQPFTGISTSYDYMSTVTWPTTIYMYQIRCPKCRKFNWAQLDKQIECKGCKSTLKAVSKKVDYEIAVGE